MANTKTHSPDGAVHADLLGARNRFRFRARRVGSQDLTRPLRCHITLQDGQVLDLEVADLSQTGLGVLSEQDLPLAQGENLDPVRILYGERVEWEGEVSVVYQVAKPRPRLGLRFVSGFFDIERLELGDALVEKKLSRELNDIQLSQELLSPEWRSEVGHLRQLLASAKDFLDQMESQLKRGVWWRQGMDERDLCRSVFEKWGQPYLEKVRHLDRISRGFDKRQLEQAYSFARRELLNLYLHCPMQGRAYEKPHGYAGDYRLMTLFFDQNLHGDSLFGKFMNYLAQHYTLARAVIHREQRMREAVRQTSQLGRPCRIMSLASGPALELQNFLREIEELEHPVELILVDQDEESLEYAYESLNRILLEKHHGKLKVEITCLHFSVRQILTPKDQSEIDIVRKVLKDVDLIYSAGLMDYMPKPIGQALLRSLYRLVRPGGRLFIGNLERVPDTSWVMEFALAWHLEYRDDTSMMELGERLRPVPETMGLVKDKTGLCLFLDIVRPKA
ncbi:MAG: hypothetical protein DWQ01_03345 [Planctomycetota bacterium]|nr:MAG: hypothetical protein DWQ01_03345 [Planctomycetota bacterium]